MARVSVANVTELWASGPSFVNGHQAPILHMRKLADGDDQWFTCPECNGEIHASMSVNGVMKVACACCVVITV